ncbi:uncharacterized protein FOMMEDRAFT_157237 [Fomitiporia mediterranea MF3/22]|uniref:uncharacterized protein n=1 Tax=Fomitiporia mediterranea (strain MF3/22) TaxID=694068 RepID=UPI00044076BD|nr:uncharacterized protein FOMMEDRAFT_157237 [Fomitiporia mediterranea MF3/22]EJD02047.1 hypothetical protein FOMMEDRAFT_157237 [Fomitiporia mediterranea MF3/22]
MALQIPFPSPPQHKKTPNTTTGTWWYARTARTAQSPMYCGLNDALRVKEAGSGSSRESRALLLALLSNPSFSTFNQFARRSQPVLIE